MYVCYWWEETRMSWEHFIYFAIAAVLLWAVGAWAAWKSKTGMAYATTVLGLLFFFSFILSMWISLERPPLRTMGETRLWYSFFLPLAGLIVYSRWNDITDNLVYVGLAFLTIGMLFGALWAKEAWGHYWSWDPKETWAAITWLAYLIYVHYRQLQLHRERLALWIIIISFVLLQMCWWGINYLPSAQGSSVHTYSISE